MRRRSLLAAVRVAAIRDAILDALLLEGGDVTRAARRLHLDRRALYAAATRAGLDLAVEGRLIRGDRGRQGV